MSLVGLGSVPLLACRVFSSKLAECAAPKSQSQCDQMNVDKNSTQLVTAETSCCVASNAPIPEFQPAASGFPQPAPIAVLGAMDNISRLERSLAAPMVPQPSPPAFQSLLCTFLI